MDDDFGDISAEEAPAPPPPQPKAKRSLFAKKITTKVPESAEPVDFFSRAKDIYHQQRAEEERRRQKKLVKLERKRSSMSAEVKEGSPSGEKRRRVSEHREGYSSDDGAMNHDVGIGEGHRDSAHSSQGRGRYQNQTTPTSLSARYSKDLSARRSGSPKQNDLAKGYVSLSDSDGDDASASEEEIQRISTKLPVRKVTTQPISLGDDDDDFSIAPRKAQPQPVEEEAEFSDEEFPELVAAAKERARQHAAQKLAAQQAFAKQDHSDLDGDDIFETGAPTKNLDPVVDILITSKIQGSKPLAVKRKLYGKLREVRWAWCDKQLFDGQKMTPEMKDTVFLTWKGNQLFDWSDCSACVDGGGKLSMNNTDDGKVHLEAWTQDTFDAWKKGHEAKQRGERENSEDEPVVEPAPVQRTRLIMKSREYPDYKLQVKAVTTIQKMIDAFRSAKDVPDEKEITLHFDGDKLDPEERVEDTELGDMDSVEVHIQ
ncbi:ubiquitin-2 like Rad60 SUMO-like-domain-containing protein [Rhexocercosporidium sp. MPI-PUGE-AT-0058]|nr:ubiquitin-2 like Rad60 SUMO-like-domain-containing protein [Rhexocercosporidium sp. MPI-PUGE-AT-0058]